MKRKHTNVVKDSNLQTASNVISAKNVTNDELINAIKDGADVIMKTHDGKHVKIEGIKPVKGFEDFINKLSGKDATEEQKKIIRDNVEVWTPDSLEKKEERLLEIVFTPDKSLKDYNILFIPKF